MQGTGMSRHAGGGTGAPNRGEVDRKRRRARAVLVLVSGLLIAIVAFCMVEIATGAHATTSPSSGYGADGSSYVNLPHAAIIWLAIAMTSLIAIMALGIAAAFSDQQ
ncbi:hypothetical protein GCM10011575_20360 [Microlunatus endophyticus]|uniref:Uncharacterized protein n=1 Tax=Microlunatus endophyticus TaxID=1716077 RepID=A0A917W476_9ACTN|nr:hypothetical protein GCM10011575_20360 [Microlunatus endophyticus]